MDCDALDLEAGQFGRAGVGVERASPIAIPNLFSAAPVVILAWPPASTSGLTRKPTGALAPIAVATADSVSASATDSRLNW